MKPSFTEIIFKSASVVFLSSFPFLFSLDGDFVFDDSEAILKNKDVRSDSWLDCFHNDFWGTDIRSNLSHKSYRPLTVFTFRLNYILNNKQLTALPFKLTNLLCHTLCCLLVWLTFRNILNAVNMNLKGKTSIDISYWATLLFAIHPVHVEAVCGVVGRADILGGVTYFLAFLLYYKATLAQKCSYLYLLLSIMTAAISMLFKENGITILGFCLFYDLIVIESKKRKTGNFLKVYNLRVCIRIITTFVLTILILCGRWLVMGGAKPVFKPIDNPAAFAENSYTKVASFNYIYFINFLLLLWPQWLCYDWSMGCIPLIQNVLDFRILLPVLLYIYSLLILANLFKKNKKASKRVLVLSVALTVIPFLPASNIFFPVGFVIAERILYIPSAGYCLLIAVGFNKLISKTKRNNIFIFCYVFLILTFGLKSWKRSFHWKNEYHLFMSGLSVCPLNAKVQYNAAKVADASNNTDFALYSYKEAIRMYPEYYQAMNNLANLLKNQKKYSEAEYYLRNSLRYKQDFPAAWMNLGIILASTKRLQESEIAYKTALQHRNKYPDCFYNLGNLYLEMNRTKDAMENWLHAVNLNPKHVLAWTNLIALLDNTDQLDKAMKIIPDALKELPASPSVNFAVANIYGKMERFAEAEQYFLKAIKLFGTKVQAIHYANLGVLYHRWKKYGLAETMYKNALNIDPSFRSAQKNLQSVHKLLNK